VARTSHHIYGEDEDGLKSGKKKLKSQPKAAKSKKTDPDPSPEDLAKTAAKSAFPSGIKPMLATLTDQPFDDPGWIYEVKWDGYRAIGYIRRGSVEIRSRNNLLLNDKFKTVTQALRNWKVNAVVDGEIIAEDEKGMANFQQLQGYQKNANEARIVYYVFDLIWYEGRDLRNLPLETRKEILENILPEDHTVLRFSDHIREKGKEFFKLATRKGLEGIMAKKSDSEYVPGFRSTSWLKIKNYQFLEAIICGFTEPRRSRKYFGAIILGKYQGNTLRYIGHSGSGFDDQTLRDLYAKFKPLITDECPFEPVPKTNMPVTWIKPKWVCAIKFSEWTDEKLLRHPIFAGLREDKQASGEMNEKIVSPPTRRKKIDHTNRRS
jgi:bifunctional non-homologous end joining protein LigD